MNILIGIPTFNGDVNYKTIQSLLKLFEKLKKQNIKYRLVFKQGSHINRIRNELVNEFLVSNYDKLLFIDADVYNFENGVYKMLKLCYLQSEYNNSLMGIAYPKKKFENILLRKNILNKDNLFDSSTLFNVNLYDNNIKQKLKESDENNGLIKVKHLATGCLLIDRKVFEKINDVNFYIDMYNNKIYNYFDSFIKDGKYLTEDYGFCEICTRNKINIYCLSNAKISHIGQFDYTGNFNNMLKKID